MSRVHGNRALKEMGSNTASETLKGEGRLMSPIKGKGWKVALQTSDAIRVGTNLPLIVDTTELVTPALARELLENNKLNRPVNWNQVDKYADIMRRGEWKLHGQGIMIGSDGNLITGQQRLWAIVMSGVSVYMRISRGNPPDVAPLVDRGRPQSATDLASRSTERKHTQTESSIARGISVLKGNLRPSKDELAENIVENENIISAILAETRGTAKSRAVLMLLSAICTQAYDENQARLLAVRVNDLVEKLTEALKPETAERCWGRGAAFRLAMDRAQQCINNAQDAL